MKCSIAWSMIGSCYKKGSLSTFGMRSWRNFVARKADRSDVELGSRGAKRWEIGGVNRDPSCRCRQEDVDVDMVRSCR